MSSRLNLSKPRSTSSSGGCIKSGLNISTSSYIARGSTTSPNTTRHIHCFHNKNNNSSAFAIPSPPANKTPTQVQNIVWTLTEGSSGNVETLLTTTASPSTTIISSETAGNSPSSVLETVQKPVKNMAGNIRIVDSKRTRRHWTLRDRSNMSIHFMKANLAEEGCEESQLDVAKKLLQDSRDPEILESAQKENSRLAIYWLVKSSEQGNVAATKLLKECLDSGHGITAQNLPDVMTCINTPTNEKLTYKAARLLYLKLNNGEKFITTTQLLSRIETLNKKVVHFAEESSESESNQDSLNSTLTDEGGERTHPDVKLNETFTYHRSHSRSPQSSPEADEDDSNKAEILPINSSNVNQEGVKLTLEDLLKCASIFNAGESPRPSINRNHKELGRHTWKFGSQFNAFCFQLLFLCAITHAVSLNNCVLLAAALLSLWASFNLLRWNQTHLNFKNWSKAFSSVSHDHHVWSDEGAESRIISNSLTTYLGGLVLSTVIFFTLDGLNTLKVVNGGLVSFALLRTRAVQSHGFPTLKLIGFLAIINFSTVLSTCIEYLEDFDLNVQGFPSEYFLQFPESLKNHFVLAIQIMAVLSLLIGTRTTSFLQKNLPELLISLWITKMLNIMISLKLHQTDSTFLNLGIGLLISAIIITLIMIIQSQLDHSRMILSVGFVMLVGTAFATIISSSMEENPIRTAISSLQHSKNPMLFHGSHQNIDDLPLLDWEVYDASCHRKAWKTRNLSPAFTQLSCFSKYGKTPTAVRWKGKISLVKIREMTHSQSVGVSFDIMVNLMTESSPETGPSSSWQQFLPGSAEHHAVAEAPSPALVLVSTVQIVGDISVKQKTIDFVVSLQTGDKIEFHGLLSPTTIGSLRPEIENVQSIRCMECAAFHGKSQDEFFIHPHSYQHKFQHSKSSSPLSRLQTTSATDHSNSHFQSLFNQIKEFITELINVVKKTSNFMLV